MNQNKHATVCFVLRVTDGVLVTCFINNRTHRTLFVGCASRVAGSLEDNSIVVWRSLTTGALKKNSNLVMRFAKRILQSVNWQPVMKGIHTGVTSVVRPFRSNFRAGPKCTASFFLELNTLH
jgi:hypothetical protein